MSWARVAAKDLRVEWRSRETLLPLLLTGLVVVAIGLLSFHDAKEREAVAAGVLWMGLAFSASVGLARTFNAERDRGTLDTLLTLPVERASLYLGKAAAAFATILLVALVLVPAYLLVEGPAEPAALPGLVLLVLLGCLGLAATGTMLGVLVASARTRDTLLPVLLLPLLIPLLLSAIHGTLDVLRGEAFAEWRPELLVLAGYDVAFLAASALLFDQAVGA